MPTNLEKAKVLIGRSILSAEDKDFWQKELAIAPEELTIFLVDFLEMMPERLPLLTDLYKKKKEAVKKQDSESLRQITKKEQETLE